jgi:hypothetical protein
MFSNSVMFFQSVLRWRGFAPSLHACIGPGLDRLVPAQLPNWARRRDCGVVIAAEMEGTMTIMVSSISALSLYK